MYWFFCFDPEPGVLYCNRTRDFSCWPPTRAGEMVEMQCFESMFTDTRLNVTKRCLENGTWEKSNFLTCLSKPHTMNSNYDTNLAIYTVGYSLTNLTLIMAIAIFLYFKSLRCLRNLIHCNLMLAMFISNIKWLVLKETITQFTHSSSGVLCRTLASVVTYFNTTVYFWMFVEGIYLFSVVIYAYEAHKIRLWHFLLVGWGCPLVVVIIWASLLIKLGEGVDSCWLPRDASLSAHTLIVGSCLTVLVINAIIVVIVIWVLVRKLRTSAAIESQQVTKAVKAIVVLLPLLGLHFILTYLVESFNSNPKKPSFIIRNFVQAFQGLLVATFYCFLNSEVKATLRQKLKTFQQSRSIQRYTKSRTSVHAVSSTSYNMIDKSPKTSVVSKGSIDDRDTCVSMMDSAV
ncbi:Corticotropin-releasing factor receptor 1 [Bulinus truncatus]|nr:Corticotropin-releasing factor receptor 1 [Bulinus truncatus]